MTKQRPPQARTGIACPHCRARMQIRSSREITVTCWQLTFACTDAECAGTYRGTIAVSHQISPSARPNPAVQLGLSPPRKRAANDNPPAAPEVAAANDDLPLGEALEA